MVRLHRRPKRVTRPQVLFSETVAVVMEANLGWPIDVKEVAEAFGGKLIPKLPQVVVLTKEVPRTHVLLFTTGKIVCIGGRNGGAYPGVVRKRMIEVSLDLYKRLGYWCSLTDIETQTVVKKCKLGFKLHINRLARAVHKPVNHDSENTSIKFGNPNGNELVRIYRKGIALLFGNGDWPEKHLQSILPILQKYKY
jgi:TATA-box binding protein (TBP) (component of TFIID and TFIIIB)